MTSRDVDLSHSMANESRSSARKQLRELCYVAGSSWQQDIRRYCSAAIERPRQRDAARRRRAARRSSREAARRRPATSIRIVSSTTERWSSNSLRVRLAARGRARRASRASRRAAVPTAGRGNATRRGSLRSCPTPTKSAWNSSRDRHRRRRRRSRRATHPTPGATPAARRRRHRAAGASGRRRRDRGEQRRVGRVREQPREQRVELGARLVLGLEPALDARSPPQTSRMSTLALVLHEVDRRGSRRTS